MLEDYEYITEELPLDMYSMSQRYIDTWEEMQECVEAIRDNYGLSFEEYATARNELLRLNNGRLLNQDFQNYLLNRMIFDLVGRGYFALDPLSTPNNIQFILSEKSLGIVALIAGGWSERIDFKKCPTDAFEAILFFRNTGVIDYLYDAAVKRQYCN